MTAYTEEFSAETAGRMEVLTGHLKRRLAVEEYFERSGRTYRKGRPHLWFDRILTPVLLKVGLQMTGLYARGVRNALTPTVRTLRLSFPNLPPAFDGFQILHLSDFHIDGNEALADCLSPALARLEPDVCVFTGDYRFDSMGPCEAVYPPMRRIISSISARHGIFAILGNHDAGEIAFELENLGVRMLVNEAVELCERGDSLWLAGIDDSFDYRCDDLPAALSTVPARAFKILLAHSPDRYRQAADSGIDLYLCGHTHAGQIRLPRIGSLKHNSKVPRTYSYGHWRSNEMHGYTTAGIGCSSLPVRYCCPPEIVLIELARQ